MKETTVKGVTLVAKGITKITKDESRKIIGGIFDPIISEGCGCCICKLNVASRGAGDYTAVASGGK